MWLDCKRFCIGISFANQKKCQDGPQNKREVDGEDPDTKNRSPSFVVARCILAILFFNFSNEMLLCPILVLVVMGASSIPHGLRDHPAGCVGHIVHTIKRGD